MHTPDEEIATPGRIAGAWVMGYMMCAQGRTAAECKLKEGTNSRLVTEFWDGWNARFDEE